MCLSLCNIMFVILTCFHLTIFLEMKNSAHCLLKTKWLMKICHFSGVLLRHQILKLQTFVRKLLILVCCFFSVIWNITQINFFKTKCKLKCQNDFLGNYFWNLETPVFIFYVFITKIYLTNIWRNNWRFSIWGRKRTLLRSPIISTAFTTANLPTTPLSEETDLDFVATTKSKGATLSCQGGIWVLLIECTS